MKFEGFEIDSRLFWKYMNNRMNKWRNYLDKLLPLRVE